MLPGEVSRGPRRRASVAITALAVAAGALFPPPARAETNAKVRVLILPHLSYGAFFIARELGYFTAQGIDVEFVKLERSSGALPLLLSGELDAMAMAYSPALFHAVAAGERVRIVAGLSVTLPDDGCASAGLVVRTGVELTPGARGLRVAANRANLGGYTLERLLEAKGLDPAEQRFVDLSGSAELMAFLEGQVDAAVLSEPRLRQVTDAGAARLVLPTRDVLPNLNPSVVVFGRRLLAERALGERFTAALLAGVAVYREGHTPRNVELIARALEIEPEVLDRACWWPMLPGGGVEPEPVQVYQRWEVARGNLDRVVAPEEWWDGGFIQRAAPNPTGSRADGSR